jgi:hypothetical protein
VRGFAFFRVPAGEGEEEEEADEREDYCDDAGDLLVVALYPWELRGAYIKYGKTIVSLN